MLPLCWCVSFFTSTGIPMASASIYLMSELKNDDSARHIIPVSDSVRRTNSIYRSGSNSGPDENSLEEYNKSVT